MRVKALTGSASEVVHVPYERAYSEGFEDLRRRVPDIGKIRGLIGFVPEYALDATLDKSSPEAHRLLVRWGRLHEVRTVLGLGAFIVFVLASRRA